MVVRIHPGQSLSTPWIMASRSLYGALARAAAWALVAGALAPHGARAQAIRGAADTAVVVVDSSDVLGRARREQERFENRRHTLLPFNPWAGQGGGPCDERVGRFCVWFGGGDWVPKPEAPGIGEARDRLLAYLDSVQALLPGDGWLAAQRVRYRGEAGRWDEALASASGCGAEGWWCAALRGLALHGLGRHEEAGDAFRQALTTMEPERARRWRDPRRLLQGEALRAVNRAREEEERAPAPGETMSTLLWALADPLFLVPGNDRETAHYARWTMATLSERARNPHRISWGRDLEELTVRMGWELGWERTRDAMGRESVVGHHHPEGRDFLPRGVALTDPAGAPSRDFEAGTYRARSFHAPAEAPVVLPMEGQVAVFPRGSRMAVVATHFLPADTGRDASKDRERPWMAPGAQEGMPHRAGLFLLPLDGGPLRSREMAGREEGALLLEAPAGAWVLGVESWAPPLRRAGRYRAGLRRDTVPEDVPTLSDLLLVVGGGPEPATLEDAAGAALARARVGEGGAVGVVWELAGVGWSAGVVRYELTAERVGVGALRRLAQALRLAERETPQSLAWEEPLPQRPGRTLRRVVLDLGDRAPGTYEIRLQARLEGRRLLTARTGVERGDGLGDGGALR